ncbi:CDP-glycerol glycerophosphotransferase family protein [Providencia rettgeri]
MINKIFILILNVLNVLCPKDKNKVVFCGYPDFDDMLRGLLPCLTHRKVIILISNEANKVPDWVKLENVTYIKKYTLLGFWHIVSSKYIYFTHGLYNGFDTISSKRQLVINLWHGMPLKNIAKLDGAISWPVSHKVISTSPIFQGIMSRAFDVDLSCVMVCGLPRNNILLQSPSIKLRHSLKENFSKMYVWLPTYRVSNKGDVRIDGDISSIFGMDGIVVDELNDKLKRLNALIIIKPHPMAVYDDLKKSYSNIKLVDEEWILNNNTSLYEILSISDALITDYSSVFVDYLLLNRPIIFTLSDLKQYSSNRGFCLELPEFPGYVVSSAKELYDILHSDLEAYKDISFYHSEMNFNLGLLGIDNGKNIN